MDLPGILVRFTARSGCLIFPKVSLGLDVHSSSHSVGKEVNFLWGNDAAV